jgi:hypothetical protein
MTLDQLARHADHGRAAPLVPASPEDLGARLADEGRHIRLDDILHAAAVNALGPDGRLAVGKEEWAKIDAAIRAAVVSVASDALDRLATDLAATLRGRAPEAMRRLGDQRRRVELGYD